MRVSVAFATPDRQEVLELDVPEGSTIDEAVALSGIQSRFPDIDLAPLAKGVWYEKKPGDTVLKDGDRVEVYRPLIIDAKESRRLRAQKEKKKEKQKN